MIKKEVLNHYRGHEEFIRRLNDLVEYSLRTGRCFMTSFLTPSEIAAAQRFLGSEIDYEIDGGYLNAEMARIVLNPAMKKEGEVCACLIARYNSKFVKITHRDVLGALMNLQIERNQFGDLWVEEDRIILYCTAEIKDFIMMNLQQIHRLNVRFEQSPEHIGKVQSFETFTKIVSSCRLDCLVAALSGCSRGKAQEKIRQQFVSVNDEILEDSSYLCNNEDTISIRRVGRFIFVRRLSTTKKEKLVAEFKKYC